MIAFDTNLPEHAYILGFLLTDGNLYQQTGNKGKLSIEINRKDAEILYKIKDFFECNVFITERSRETNFGLSHTTTLTLHDLKTRENLLLAGMVYGRKSDLISTPDQSYSEIDFWRGIIDGDGSLGITKKTKIPFVSLTTASDILAEQYKSFIRRSLDIDVSSQRNKRDNVHNIMITREAAQSFASMLYYPNCLSLERKRLKARECIEWKRPEGMIRIMNRKSWDMDQDTMLLSLTDEEAATALNRTICSIENRRKRLSLSKGQILRQP